MLEKSVPRTGYKVFDESGEKELGYITTGSYAPTLDKYLAMAYVPVDESAVGTKVKVEIRNRKYAAEIVKMPFYKREGKRSETSGKPEVHRVHGTRGQKTTRHIWASPTSPRISSMTFSSNAEIGRRLRPADLLDGRVG